MTEHPPIKITIKLLGTKLIDQENEISLRRVEGIDLLKLNPCCIEFLSAITPLMNEPSEIRVCKCQITLQVAYL